MESLPETRDQQFAVLDGEISRFRSSRAPETLVHLHRAADSVTGSASLLEFGPIGATVSASLDEWSAAGTGSHLTLTTTNETGSDEYRCVVTYEGPDPNTSGRLLLGLRFVFHELGSDSDIERRRYARWKCPEQFHPTGISANPIRSNDFVYFRVGDISSDGLGLLTSPRNRYLVAGQRLDAIISFPTVRQISIQLLIRNVRMVSIRDRDYLQVGASVVGPTRLQQTVIEQYVLQFGPAQDAAFVRVMGISQRTSKRPTSFSFVTDEETYREVINLRRLAYRFEGKAGANDALAELSDLHDSRSRILVCRSHGRIVASARLAFPEYGDRTEHEEYFEWPTDFPRRDQTVEVTRACTHPDFRKGGVFFSLLRFIVVTAMQSGRPWVVTSSTEDLVRMYDWIGLKPCNRTYDHPSLNGMRHHVLIGNIPAALLGRSIGPGAWYAVWKDALPFLNEADYGGLSSLRLALYRVIGWGSAKVRAMQRI